MLVATCALSPPPVPLLAQVFVFSSRRRHTRYWRDWSSDVCSSDLLDLQVEAAGERAQRRPVVVQPVRFDRVTGGAGPEGAPGVVQLGRQVEHEDGQARTVRHGGEPSRGRCPKGRGGAPRGGPSRGGRRLPDEDREELRADRYGSWLRCRPVGRQVAQNGGQGSAGQSPLGWGYRPVRSSSATRCWVRRTSRRVRCSCSWSPRSPIRSPVSFSSASTASAGSGCPAQRHSRVRSLGSTEKQMPWSTPYTCPSEVGMMCPPLRSALLTTASKTAMRRSPGSSERTKAARSTSGSPSTHSCTMPGPNGPSRSTVGGTTRQPVASLTSAADTSRPARVPSGKSHSGRSPATGL